MVITRLDSGVTGTLHERNMPIDRHGASREGPLAVEGQMLLCRVVKVGHLSPQPFLRATTAHADVGGRPALVVPRW